MKQGKGFFTTLSSSLLCFIKYVIYNLCKLHKPCISDSKLNIILLLVLEYKQTSIHIKINNFPYGFPSKACFCT